ncbi:hypothetical protein [Sphingomonas sp. CFBP 8760]|uniref:hypothetical protein n=1 Tax=Sphingomonas sp. CFBP 8760 TaxID=2775282 RepID=UPI00177BA5E5|nr:hypothetical protein [Sphingomonas sp. CFBP 8760]MBD8547900.1 hypothetical protein [Sphingomonas sp. CFBP 8760]
MSAAETITGGVNNGQRGTAVFTFYQGPVGIRNRSGWFEVAFFSSVVRPELPAAGLLDGKDVMVTGVTTRHLDPANPAKGRSEEPRAITATVVPIT